LQALIDWELPIVAIPTERHGGGRIASISVATDYAKRADAMPVRFDQNLWARGCESGTWYFNHHGLAVGGISKDGYEGRYTIANA
jgi:hypothetical protein